MAGAGLSTSRLTFLDLTLVGRESSARVAKQEISEERAGSTHKAMTEHRVLFMYEINNGQSNHIIPGVRK